MKKALRMLPLLVLVLALLAWPSPSQQTQHSVSLAWTASTTPGANYVVWRGTVSGGPYTILTPTPFSAVTYTDTSGTGGTKYFYVVQATCTGGTCPSGISGQSAFSNEVSATFLGAPQAEGAAGEPKPGGRALARARGEAP